jgi:hypothetical protein
MNMLSNPCQEKNTRSDDILKKSGRVGSKPNSILDFGMRHWLACLALQSIAGKDLGCISFLRSWRIRVRQIGHDVGRQAMKDEGIIWQLPLFCLQAVPQTLIPLSGH